MSNAFEFDRLILVLVFENGFFNILHSSEPVTKNKLLRYLKINKMF